MATAAPLTPYANIFPARLLPKALPPAREVDRVSPARIRPPMGRPSYDLFGSGLAGTPLAQIREVQNLAKFPLYREVLPITDAAVHKLRQFVGTPSVECQNDETEAEINDWLETRFHCNRLQTGFALGFGTLLDDMLTYGRSHTEILLTADQREVWGVQELLPTTVFYRPSTDRVTVEVVQRQPGAQWKALNPLLMMNTQFDVRGDDPYGKSLFHSIPMTAETATGMMKAVGQLWTRFGSPSYQVNVNPPEGLSDNSGDKMGAFMSQVQNDWDSAMRSRAEGDVRDFFSSGETTVNVIGAAGEELQLNDPWRALMEQMLSKFGLPPFLFGLIWATTERMSAVQALLLERMICWLRVAVTSEVTYMIDLRQRITGGDREFKLSWPEISLMDASETAAAEKTQAEADKAKRENALALWRAGFWNGYDFARCCVPGYEGLDDEEIDAARAARGLGPIPAEPPAPELPAFGQAQPGQPGGGPGPNPPLRPVRSLAYDLSSFKGGNGNH